MIETKHRTLASVYLVNDALASNLAMLTALNISDDLSRLIVGPVPA